MRAATWRPASGAPPRPCPAATAPAEPDGIRALAGELYLRLYTGAGGAPWPEVDPLARREHIARLSEANRGRGTWEPGWTIRGVDGDGRVAVEKDGLTFWAERDRLRPGAAEVGEIAPGARCRVKVGKELIELQAGFYIAIGDGEGDEEEDGGDVLVRLYWHLTSAAAVPFVGLLTGRLNDLGLPFRMKTLSDPRAYRRADAGVLYLGKRHYSAARAEIVASYHTLADRIRPATPLLTKRLAPGLAVAEDPGGGASFGQHRCTLVARALWRAFEHGRRSPRERLETVAAAFRQEGLDPHRPYLAPGSTALYRPLARRLHPTPAPVAAAPGARAGPELFLAAARRIGDALCRSAYWHRQRCNWMGRSGDEVSVLGGLVTPTSAALGPELYAGTAGVGLFLARLHAATGDERYRATARGAILQALGRLRAEPAVLPPLSFFTGRVGVAWAAAEIGSLTGSANLVRSGSKVLTGALKTPVGESEPLDFIGGAAGAILALLGPVMPGAPARRLRPAVAQGETICAAAEAIGPAWAWTSIRASGAELGPQPLTGLGHGATGLGLALLALFAATGREDFRDGARRAFAYEDGLFDERRGNWPDLRRREADDSPRFAVAWCHGARGDRPGAAAGATARSRGRRALPAGGACRDRHHGRGSGDPGRRFRVRRQPLPWRRRPRRSGLPGRRDPRRGRSPPPRPRRDPHAAHPARRARRLAVRRPVPGLQPVAPAR